MKDWVVHEENNRCLIFCQILLVFFQIIFVGTIGRNYKIQLPIIKNELPQSAL